MQRHCTSDPDQEHRFLEQFQASALECHARVLSEGKDDPSRQGMATTLTLAIGHWPWACVVQVGDSRCCQLHAGKPIQITRDQTVAEETCELLLEDALAGGGEDNITIVVGRVNQNEE